MFDVFYRGPKPNLFPYERPARDLFDASNQSRTKYFWLLHGDNDYTDFDFWWMPDKWVADRTHIWTGINLDAETYFSIKNTATANFDIVFLSNGEPESDRLYELLLERTRKYSNRVKRVSGIDGRADAIKACASVSETPWFYIVYAKLEVVENFNWAWAPWDSQTPRHYIFYSRNVLNGLEYGHMAMVLFNKQLVLDTDQWGLDFTLSKPHCVVPVVSGIAHYNQSPLITWRTAFREAVKLKQYTGQDRDAQARLDVWTTKAEGKNAEWSIRGALDGVDFYHEVNGDMNELMKSFDWHWLDARFQELYPTID